MQTSTAFLDALMSRRERVLRGAILESFRYAKLGGATFLDSAAAMRFIYAPRALRSCTSALVLASQVNFEETSSRAFFPNLSVLFEGPKVAMSTLKAERRDATQ